MKNVSDRQGLNDKAMASIFKIMKLDYSLAAQDEIDRYSLNLMGLTNIGQQKEIKQTLTQL